MSEHNAENDAEGLRGRVAAIEALHQDDGDGRYIHDGFTYPCPTARIINPQPCDVKAPHDAHEDCGGVPHTADQPLAGRVIPPG